MDEMNPNQSLDTPIRDKELVLSKKCISFSDNTPFCGMYATSGGSTFAFPDLKPN